MKPPQLTVLATNRPRFVEAFASRHMKFVARPRECRQNRVGAQIWRCAALTREFWEFRKAEEVTGFELKVYFKFPHHH